MIVFMNRRGFIKNSGFTVAGIGLSGLAIIPNNAIESASGHQVLSDKLNTGAWNLRRPSFARAGHRQRTGQSPTKLPEFLAYRMQDDSPCIAKELNLRKQFGLNTGERDFFGNALPADGSCDIGLHGFSKQK